MGRRGRTGERRHHKKFVSGAIDAAPWCDLRGVWRLNDVSAIHGMRRHARADARH